MAEQHYRWEISPDFPQGYAVPFTAEEEAQYEADQTAGAIETAARETEETNARTIRERLANALANLETAYSNWAALTAAQKDAAIKLDVRTTAGLVRLYLRDLESAGNGT